MGNHEGVGPVLPAQKKERSPQLWPSYQLVMCGFLRLSSQSFSDEKHRRRGRGKRNEKKKKKGGLVPTEKKKCFGFLEE